VVVGDKSELDGLGDAEIAAAAEAARERKLDGKWVLAAAEHHPAAGAGLAQEPGPAATVVHRVDHQDRAWGFERHASDRQAVGAATRPARQLLGYPERRKRSCSTTAWPRPRTRRFKLLSDLVPAATARARARSGETAGDDQQAARGFKLAPWDWQYYAEQVRKAEYALDESQLMPYFELDRVLKDGVFFAANRLYGLTFKQRTDLPVYHPDVAGIRSVRCRRDVARALVLRLFQARQQGRWRVGKTAFVDGSGL